jgi:hypothetical protein
MNLKNITNKKMRTIFNNIISENNLPPKPNTEYIYNLDLAWNKFGMVNVTKGIIVENVEQLDCGSYSFNIKGECEEFTCSYGWAFVENNEKNIQLLKEIELETILWEQQKMKIKTMKSKLGGLFDYKIEKGEIGEVE